MNSPKQFNKENIENEGKVDTRTITLLYRGLVLSLIFAGAVAHSPNKSSDMLKTGGIGTPEINMLTEKEDQEDKEKPVVKKRRNRRKHKKAYNSLPEPPVDPGSKEAIIIDKMKKMGKKRGKRKMFAHLPSPE